MTCLMKKSLYISVDQERFLQPCCTSIDTSIDTLEVALLSALDLHIHLTIFHLLLHLTLRTPLSHSFRQTQFHINVIFWLLSLARRHHMLTQLFFHTVTIPTLKL